MKISDIEFEMHSNYVEEDVIESVIKYVKAHGFNAKKIDELLVSLGYDEIFTHLEDGSEENDYVVRMPHRRQLVD
ncbi:MAG: hypothetical protein KU29_03650 [Sulfurovum sp. FS06-10]|jgi:outer membrane protein assembly factor BamA|nr:MAG: hypothetical protein KU29_03650 [Sulfurovum sp. FS06-10]